MQITSLIFSSRFSNRDMLKDLHLIKTMDPYQKLGDGSSTTSSSSTSIPSVVSKLDRLDSMTNYLERKVDSSRWASDVEVEISPNELVPLDLALKEAQSKGSIMDRIASLEDRLIQLYSLIKCRTTSPSNCSEIDQTLGTTTSLHRSSKGSSSNSLFRLRTTSRNTQKEASDVCMDNILGTELKQHDEASFDKKSWRKKKTYGRVSSLKAKKISHSNWLHKRLLGC